MMIDFSRNYTPREVAEMLKMSPQRVRDYCRVPPRNGGLPSMRIGGRILINEKDLQEWLETKRRWSHA